MSEQEQKAGTQKSSPELGIEVLGEVTRLINAASREVTETVQQGEFVNIGIQQATDDLDEIVGNGYLASFHNEFEERQRTHIEVPIKFIRALDEVLMAKHGCFPERPGALATPSQIAFYLMCCEVRKLAGENYAQRKLDSAQWLEPALRNYYQLKQSTEEK